MKLTEDLIRECFGPTTKISSRFPFAGYKIKTPAGGTMIVTDLEFRNVRGGAHLYDGAARLAAALGWSHMLAKGTIEHIAHSQLSGKIVGLPVEAGETKRFFGLVKEPPPALPRPSGTHGSQGISWTDADLKACGLLGAGYGEGIRVGASQETGTPLRYAGEDAELSIIGFGPSGSGKGVAFQGPAIMEFHGSSTAPKGNSVTFDPSGQLFMICAPELLRQGVRLIPIMLFPEDFPAEVRALAKRSRCLNAMDPLKPHSPSFASDCFTLGHILRPDDSAHQGGDPFFKLSGGNLIAMLIGCVKLYAHPSEQNLSEVYHKLGDVFGYARAIRKSHPHLPRFIATQLQRWTAPLAENNKTLLSIVEQALSELAWLGEEAVQQVLLTSSFAWEDVKNSPRPVAIFFLLPVGRLESHKAFLSLFAGVALTELSKTERGRHSVLLTIDEAGLLDLPILQRAFAETRKRGVQLSVWYQNTAQAAKRFGETGLNNMLSGSDLQIYLRPRHLAEAEFIAHQIGTYTEIVPHFSYAPGRDGKPQESVSFAEQGRPVLFAQDIMNLPKQTAIVIAPGRSKNALQIWARPWFDCPDLKDKGGIDAYHRHRSHEE